MYTYIVYMCMYIHACTCMYTPIHIHVNVNVCHIYFSLYMCSLDTCDSLQCTCTHMYFSHAINSLSLLPLSLIFLTVPLLSSPAAQLYAELSLVNLNLPARVCIPLYGSKHQILRIPSSEAVVLNSRAKYVLHVHVHTQYVWCTCTCTYSICMVYMYM